MAALFANARAYEAQMGRWSALLVPLFAHFAQMTDGGRVLDVGCGTGALVRMVAAMTRHSEIVGLDPAQPFLAYARAQCAYPQITFDRGSTLDLNVVDLRHSLMRASYVKGCIHEQLNQDKR